VTSNARLGDSSLSMIEATSRERAHYTTRLPHLLMKKEQEQLIPRRTEHKSEIDG